MKNTFLLFGLAGITSALLSFTFIQKSDKIQEPKKVRHIKMTKIVDGKKSELDTTVTNDQVFIWQGDTVGGKEMIKHISPSGFDKKKQIKVVVEGDGKDEKVMIFHPKDGPDGEPMIWDMDQDMDFDVFSEGFGDSIRKKIIIHDKIGGRELKRMMLMNGPDHMPCPPVPPMNIVHKMNSRLIDLNDKNIISYRKKDISGNREKIEIIRIKTEEPEHSFLFDFNGDEQLMPPPPPPVPPHVPSVSGHTNKETPNDKKVETEENK